MSDAIKPPMHGRDHCPGGQDPIPCLTGAHYIAGFVIGLSIASGTGLSDVDLDPSTISWGTDSGAETASSTFDLQQIGGTGAHGITLLENGLYVLDFWASLDIAGTPAAGSCASIGTLAGSNSDIGGDGDAAPWVSNLLGTRYYSRPHKRVWLNWPADYGAPPFTTIIGLGQNSGVTVSTINVTFMCLQVDSSGNSGF